MPTCCYRAGRSETYICIPLTKKSQSQSNNSYSHCSYTSEGCATIFYFLYVVAFLRLVIFYVPIISCLLFIVVCLCLYSYIYILLWEQHQRDTISPPGIHKVFMILNPILIHSLLPKLFACMDNDCTCHHCKKANKYTLFVLIVIPSTCLRLTFECSVLVQTI